MKILDINGKVLLDVPGDTLRNIPLKFVDFKYADLRNDDFSDVDFQLADLQYAKLQYTNLQYTTFIYANLRFANFQYADLRNADLRDADLRKADLQFADLQFADFCDADLRNADLRNAKLRNNDFSEAKLKGALLPYFDETPVIHNIHKAVYEAASASNAPATVNFGATVLALAGEAGKELEEKIGTNAAAALIYMRSDKYLSKLPNLRSINKDVLEDMRRLAA